MAIDLRKIDPELSYPLKQIAQFLEISYGTILKLRKDAKLQSTCITNFGLRCNVFRLLGFREISI
jgi:hypothetical protein